MRCKIWSNNKLLIDVLSSAVGPSKAAEQVRRHLDVSCAVCVRACIRRGRLTLKWVLWTKLMTSQSLCTMHGLASSSSRRQWINTYGQNKLALRWDVYKRCRIGARKAHSTRKNARVHVFVAKSTWSTTCKLPRQTPSIGNSTNTELLRAPIDDTQIAANFRRCCQSCTSADRSQFSAIACCTSKKLDFKFTKVNWHI